jgi:CO/xanthine dehydrogenase FAD-binding subunit
MPILHEFTYEKPASVKDALRLLSKYKSPSVLAGGTDLINNLKENLNHPDAVIDVKGVEDLRGITFKDNLLTIGALSTFTELSESALIQSKFPVIAEVARSVGCTGIRNRATMAGNICSCVPCADSGPLLLAYEAKIVVRSAKGKRRVVASEWFVGNRKSDLKKGELVTAIELQRPAAKHAGCFVKLRRYAGEDLAQASVLILALPKNIYRVTFGSVGPVPIRAQAIEDLLNGSPLTDELIEESKELIPAIVKPISDIRASKEYRLHMCQVMFARGVRAAASRLAGEGPAYGTSLI